MLDEYGDLPSALRGGPIYAAADVIPTTAHSWVHANGLILGRRGETGHPRYSVEDVARLLLMRVLTDRFSMAAQAAARITNNHTYHIAHWCLPTSNQRRGRIYHAGAQIMFGFSSDDPLAEAAFLEVNLDKLCTEAKRRLSLWLRPVEPLSLVENEAA